MIITKLKGGLGNQIFQYACGRALVLRQIQKGLNPGKLKIDITGYGTHNGIDTPRQYGLNVFNIQADIATPDEIRKAKYPLGIISKGWRFIWIKVLRQGNPGFRKYIFNKTGPAFLDAYFQTEKYFIDQEKEIRRDLTLRVPLGVKAQEASNIIVGKPKSISLHVRRGDYVKDLTTNLYHGTCSPEYYAKALEHITSKIGSDIHVFVFSDDIAWVKENMPIPYPCTYVSDPSIKDYEEMHLMSLCAHNIIANSSFSWWGAWLNKNPNKIVIAPRRWVLKDDRSYRDIAPASWVRI